MPRHVATPAPRPGRSRRPRVRRRLPHAPRGGRALAAALALALTAPLALVAGVTAAQAAPAAAPLVVQAFTAAGGATPTTPVPDADPAFAQDRAYTATAPGATVDLTAAYRCASDTLDCPDATATFTLDRLRLATAVVVAGLAVDPVITYFTDADATTPTADPTAAAAFSVAFRLPLADGGVGLAAGTTGTLDAHVRVVPPAGGGPQTGSATLGTVPAAAGALPARVTVSTEFPVSLATHTTLAWAKGSYLSGVVDDAASPTNTATVTSTVTGDPADVLVVSWPATPSTRPAAGTVGMLHDLTSAVVTTWPTGAAQVQVTGWRWTGPSTAPAALDLGSVPAPAGGATSTGDLLAGLDPAVRTALVGLRLTYTTSGGATVPTSTSTVLTVDVRERESVASTPVPRSGAVDYVTDAPAGTFDPTSDLNTLTVAASAGTVARRGSQSSAQTTGTGSFRIEDPRAYAGSATTLRAASGDTVYGGGFVVATASGTNWSRRHVDELTVRVRPTAADVTAANAVVEPDVPAIDARTFGDGLTFAGFGAARGGGGSGPSGDGSGASLTQLAGSGARVVLTVHADGVATVPVTLADTATPALPTDPASFGLTTWDQVTGFTATVRGTGARVPMGASLTVPYLLRSATAGDARTYVDHTLATTRLGSDVSTVAPRTARSGNRPLTAATVLVAVPRVGVDGGKEVVEPYLSTAPGSTVQTVLTATARAGASRHLPSTLVVEDSVRAVAGGTSGTAWWGAVEPTAVLAPAGAVTHLDFYENVLGAPQWTRYTGDLTALDAGAWRGLRVSMSRSDGRAFVDGETLRAHVTFAVRAAPSGTWANGTRLHNVATVTSTATVEGHPVTSTAVPVTDDTTGVAPVGAGVPALVKKLSTLTGIEGTAATSVATLTWGTAGRAHGAVVVADANGLADQDDVPATGRTASFWDTVDLVRVLPITSEDTRVTGSAHDPYLVFDQVADVQVFDVVDGTWRSLATHHLAGGTWVPIAQVSPSPRTDARFGDSSPVGRFPYRGGFPGVTLDPTLRERVGGVRLVYEPRADRATTAPTDWRTALPAVPADVVAPTAGLVREVQLETVLRDVSRANGAPVNNAFAYTGAEAGRTTNDARVTGWDAWAGPGGSGTAADLGGPVNRADERTLRVTAASLGVAVTKTWLRDANGDPLTDSDLAGLGLPVDAGAPASQYPEATVTVTARSTATTRVDSLTVTEPAGIDAPGRTLAADDPFARFALTDLRTITDLASRGASSTDVTLYRAGPDGLVTADPVRTRAAALALTETELGTVVGVQVRYTGRIRSDATATLQARTRLLPHGRVDGLRPRDVLAGRGTFTVVDTARGTVDDARVCANETAPPTVVATCAATAPVSQDATATVHVGEPAVEAFPALGTGPVDVQRDAADPVVTATLSAQNFGLSEADEIVVTDAHAPFFNAVQARTVRLDRLPSGAEEAVLEVAVADEHLDVAPDGTYTAGLVWRSWGARSALTGTWDLAALATADGVTAEDVVAVRVRFVSTSGERITAPGQGFGQVTLSGRLREELRTGGLPSAVGAAGWTFRGRAEHAANPGESGRGVLSNRVAATAVRGGLTSPVNSSPLVLLTVHAGAATLEVQKAEVDAQVRKPGDLVRYRITVRNTSTGPTAADLTGLVLTDVLPEDGSLEYGPVPDGEPQWVVQAVDGGVSPIGGPVVMAPAGTVLFAWDDDARLAPGAAVEVLLWVRVSRDLSTSTVVNAARATSSSRPPVAVPGGTDGGTACRPGSYDAASGECRTTSSALSIGGANVYVSEEWVSAGPSSGAVRTTGGAAACMPRGTGPADRDWYRYPCAVVSEAGSTTLWQVQVTSRATIATDRLEIVDMLSAVGDYAAMDDQSGTSRGSRWRPVWDGVVPSLAAAPPGATVDVYTTTAPYRAGGLPATADFDPVPGTWSTTPLAPGAVVPAAQAARVTGFQVVVRFAAGDLLSAGESVRLQWGMRTPLTGAPASSDTWNSFAFRVPADPAAGRPVDVTSVPLKAGARYAVNAAAGELVAVGDRVWLDDDRDGVQDGGEPGVPGVVVDVYQGTGTGAVWVAEAATDASGDWLVDGLPAGTYEVRLTPTAAQAALYRFTALDAGADDVDSDALADATGATVTDVVLTAATSATTAAVADMPAAWRAAHPDLVADFVDVTRDAGLQRRWLAVGDTVWLDADRDGRQGPGEDAAAGVTVRLLDAATDAVVRTTTTGPDGTYAFLRLEPGTYAVEVELPASLASRWTFTRTGAGDAAGDSDAVATTADRGRTPAFTLTEGAGGRMADVGDLAGVPAWTGLDAQDADYADPSVDAGLAERPVTVGDRVWVDLDDDGVQDPGEHGLPGVVLTVSPAGSPGSSVTRADGTTAGPVTSDASGAYAFTGLLPGAYTVTVDAAASAGVLTPYRPSPTAATTDHATDSSAGSATSATLVGGERDATLDFGYRPLRALGDTVWVDTDRDGVQDAAEPGLSGVTVRLLDDATSAVLTTTVTDAHGRYRFDVLEPGRYRVQVALDATASARYQFTTPGGGSAVDSDVVPGAAAAVATTRTATVGPGQPGERAATAADRVTASRVDPTWDAGLVERTVSVGRVVWFDADEDGLQGPDEPGLAGVVLTLTTPDGRPVTAADGAPVGAVTTDADGRYAFTGLLPGRYVVSVDRIASATALRGYAPTAPEVGSDRGLDSSTWTATSAVLVGGEQDATLDYGLVLADDVQLALHKAAVARAGDLVTWEVTVVSTGTQDAYAGFSVFDALPAGLAPVSAAGDGFVCTTGTGPGGDVVTCRHDGSLASGGTATLRVVTRLADPGAEAANTATVTTTGHGYLFEVLESASTGWSDPPPTVVVRMPQTGADVGAAGALALLLLVVGGVLVLAARRARA